MGSTKQPTGFFEDETTPAYGRSPHSPEAAAFATASLSFLELRPELNEFLDRLAVADGIADLRAQLDAILDRLEQFGRIGDLRRRLAERLELLESGCGKAAAVYDRLPGDERRVAARRLEPQFADLEEISRGLRDVCRDIGGASR